MFDVVAIVGALSDGQVPVGVVRELCKSTKPGNTVTPSQQPLLHYLFKCAYESAHVCFKHILSTNFFFFYLFFPQTSGGYVCMTTRGNPDNVEYKVSLECELEQMEQEGLWTRVEVIQVEDWELAVSEEEHGYIPGTVYLYKKQLHSATQV